MDERQEEREKECGELEERTEERRGQRRVQKRQTNIQKLLRKLAKKMRGVGKIQSATQQRREPGSVLHSLPRNCNCGVCEGASRAVQQGDNRQKKETLWAEISAGLKLQPFYVRRWFVSQRNRYGKLSKLQSGRVLREMTKKQSWVYQQMGFLKTQIRRDSRSSGFEASPNTRK